MLAGVEKQKYYICFPTTARIELYIVSGGICNNVQFDWKRKIHAIIKVVEKTSRRHVHDQRQHEKVEARVPEM